MTKIRECYGRCHCGKIRFKTIISDIIEAIECNCSICYATGYLHYHLKEEDVTIIQGKEDLCTYKFNTMVATHLFCKTCGVKPFYRPRSHPNDFSINVRCLELPDFVKIRVQKFDGKNWEKNINRLPAQPVFEPCK